MASDESLTPQEVIFIKRRTNIITNIKAALQNFSKFNVGDFLIAFKPAHRDYWGTEMPRRQITNSFGVPKKYKVVSVDTYNIPYIKELNKTGKPVGGLLCPLTMFSDSKIEIDTTIEFQVDPSYADAIIFNDTEVFDATEELKYKSKIWHEVREHNKKHRINVDNQVELVAFLKSLKAGDLVWKTVKTHFTIISINSIPLDRRGFLDRWVDFGEAQDHKGKKFMLTHETFIGRAIYTEKPRTFNEVRDPK